MFKIINKYLIAVNHLRFFFNSKFFCECEIDTDVNFNLKKKKKRGEKEISLKNLFYKLRNL